MKRTTKQLRAIPTIRSGQFDDLKIETGRTRVWLSRMTKADGARFEHGVTEERLYPGGWLKIAEYDGGEP